MILRIKLELFHDDWTQLKTVDREWRNATLTHGLRQAITDVLADLFDRAG